jgi:histidyl-tRNA synthetase
MYTFPDKADRSVTLRPEGTAPAVRAFIENRMYANPQPTKLYYIAPMFRYEKPQEGRQRQFHQFGIECFGSDEPYCDAEIISVAKELIDTLGIKNTKIYLNCLGTGESRSKYVAELKKYLESFDLCETCKARLSFNPLRVLDCKNVKCEDIANNSPSCLDYLDEAALAHFEGVKRILEGMGIEYETDTKIVRGLDFYTKTVFEIKSGDLGAQNTVCGGGRYNNLVKLFDGPDTPGIGFGIGMERLILMLKQTEADFEIPVPEYFIGAIGDEGQKAANNLVYALRKTGVAAEGNLLKRSVKSQLKYADKIGANNSVIIGEDEIKNDTVNVKNMKTGEISAVKLSEFLSQAKVRN